MGTSSNISRNSVRCSSGGGGVVSSAADNLLELVLCHRVGGSERKGTSLYMLATALVASS